MVLSDSNCNEDDTWLRFLRIYSLRMCPLFPTRIIRNRNKTIESWKCVLIFQYRTIVTYRLLTAGPQRGPLVTQHISVLHIEQRNQSQPHFFIKTTAHVGHASASPLSTISSNISAVLRDSWSVSFDNLNSCWYCLQFLPVWIACKGKYFCKISFILT